MPNIITNHAITYTYFTYDHRLRRKLNFDEITKTIKDKLRIWKWRDLSIIGRIQLVKIFIIPTFLYRACGLICMDKEFVNEVNKIIFDFISTLKLHTWILLLKLKEYYAVKNSRVKTLVAGKLFFFIT